MHFILPLLVATLARAGTITTLYPRENVNVGAPANIDNFNENEPVAPRALKPIIKRSFDHDTTFPKQQRPSQKPSLSDGQLAEGQSKTPSVDAPDNVNSNPVDAEDNTIGKAAIVSDGLVGEKFAPGNAATRTRGGRPMLGAYGGHSKNAAQKRSSTRPMTGSPLPNNGAAWGVSDEQVAKGRAFVTKMRSQWGQETKPYDDALKAQQEAIRQKRSQ
ncbi:uncharacterized protein PpBr36_10780 [Pyricularia pennisetigena]|uniref:uncharacterized protein n=1 Tax=Pyricularia pennisetigena TaxID=1578925 RepID=UPI0011521862|nr:uncharacterized protein PpBr36_10780 [Pyricularia pennisetigena]TLS20988.1 hypothetical protein PpBr36_10780 [Pyricularia pennisetigena]